MHTSPCTLRLAPLALALSTLLAAPAFAENNPDKNKNSVTLGTVVVTATGFEQKITEAPASISVITREELATRPYLTLIDAVRDLEGVDVGETSDKTGQKTISMRGMGSEYTLVLIDGRRQNNHGDIYPNSFGGNQFGHMPPLEMIERIEVIRGPASTLYGADALGGVINIITRKVGLEWNGSLTATHNLQENSDFGSYSTVDFAISGPLVVDKLGLGLRGSWYKRNASNPEYETITAPDGTTFERSLGFGGGGKTVNNTNKTAGLTLSWTPTDNQSVMVDIDTSRLVYDNTPYINNLGTETYPLGTVDGLDGIWRSAPRVGYVKDQEFTRDQWAITHQGEWAFGSSLVALSHIETANLGRTLPFTVAERQLHTALYCNNAVTCKTGAYAGMSRAERQQLALSTFLPRPARTMESRQYTLDAKFDFNTIERHHIVVGGQLIDGELEDGVFGMEEGAGNTAAQDHRMWSLFAEDNWTPIEPLTITVGLRHDHHNVFGNQLSPRAYAVWDLASQWTLKGGVSTGFKTPKTTDLYDGITGFGGQGTIPFVGNPNLKPETSVNSEIALYWTSADTAHNFNITVFRNDFDDKIATGETNQSCAQTGGVRPCANFGDFGQLGYTSYAQNINIDEVRVQGVEIAGGVRFSKTLSLRANYTYTDSEQLSGVQKGLPLTNSAKHMANASLNWSATDRLSLQLVGENRSKRYRGLINGVRSDYEAYSVLHLAAQFQLSQNLSLNARINNLLDKDFTAFQTQWAQAADGTYTPTYLDDYNNKDKARNLWLSVNWRF